MDEAGSLVATFGHESALDWAILRNASIFISDFNRFYVYVSSILVWQFPIGEPPHPFHPEDPLWVFVQDRLYCCLYSMKPLLKWSTVPLGSSLVLLPQLRRCSFSVAFPKTIRLFFLRFCSFSPFCFLLIGADLYTVHRDIAADCRLNAGQAYGRCHVSSGIPMLLGTFLERDPGTQQSLGSVFPKDSRMLLQNEVEGAGLLWRFKLCLLIHFIQGGAATHCWSKFHPTGWTWANLKEI